MLSGEQSGRELQSNRNGKGEDQGGGGGEVYGELKEAGWLAANSIIGVREKCKTLRVSNLDK